MNVVKSFCLSEQHIEMIKRLKEVLGAKYDSEVVRLAIELAYSLISNSDPTTSSNSKEKAFVINVQAPININVVRTEARAEARASARASVRIRKTLVEVQKFLVLLLNPPKHLVPPPPWLREEAEKLYSKLVTVLET